MCHLKKIFIFLIIFFVKTKNFNAEIISSLVESDDEYDALVKKALFEKINWIIKELNYTKQRFAAYNKRQMNYEHKRRVNMNDLSLEVRQVLNQQVLKTETLVEDMKQEVANNFQTQQSFLQNLIDENSKLNENINLKHNRNWQTILRRQDSSLDFSRNWTEYKLGFGNVNGNFFVGLESLHAITSYSDPQELLIVLQDFDNKTRYAKYLDFMIGSETENYKIKQIGTYQGDAGDSFSQHLNCKFSTYDRDNDNSTMAHCAEKFQGGWWFSSCVNSFLTGTYLYQPDVDKEKYKGLVWHSWHGLKYSLKYAEMLIRPKL